MSQKSDQTTTRYTPPENGEMMSQSRPPDAPLPSSGRLLIQVDDARPTTITLQFAERILVGRSDQDSDLMPDLDLAPFGGGLGGVSRSHAIFSYRENAIFIEDLGSTNGTRLNGLGLAPKQPYRLRDGDELEFGRIRVVARFLH